MCIFNVTTSVVCLPGVLCGILNVSFPESSIPALTSMTFMLLPYDILLSPDYVPRNQFVCFVVGLLFREHLKAQPGV